MQRVLRRGLSTSSVFDFGTKVWQRDCAARDAGLSRRVDYLRDAVAERVADRILDIKRDLPRVLDLGSGAGHVTKFLDDEMGVRALVMADVSRGALYRDAAPEQPLPHGIPTERVHLGAATRGEALPGLAAASFDAVVSSMYMHWVNDLPRLLREVHRVLVPDGVFLGAMLGGDSLYELRCALQLAEQELRGGIAPRISPMVESKDLAGLLKQNNFVITTGTPEIIVDKDASK
jgi:NADH dehydrogenase [ubiquinone] 1 alpha subcomplex assembly factor 5